MEAQVLRSQGWTVSAIARHLGVTRVTVRRYLSGEQTPGVRARSSPDPFAEYVEYCRLRLGADPHLWATTLFDEVVALGYGGSYPSFTRAIRERALRPVCRLCTQGATVDRAVIEHPPGAETQWDWVELPDPPVGVGVRESFTGVPKCTIARGLGPSTPNWGKTERLHCSGYPTL